MHRGCRRLANKCTCAVQFSTIADGLANDGAIKEIFVGQLPTNPRMAGGDFVTNPNDSPWALTFVTSNFNVSLDALQGPQFIFDNTTLWAGEEYSEAQPYIKKAYASVDPVTFCIDEIAGSDTPRCMSRAVANQYQESRASTTMVGPQFGTESGASSSSSSEAPAPSGVAAAQGGAGRSARSSNRRSGPQADGGSDGTSAAVWAAPLAVSLAVLAAACARSQCTPCRTS